MTSRRRAVTRLLSAFLLVAPLSAAYAVDQKATPAPATHHKAHKKPAPFVLPPLPAGPLRQVPMDQLPAAAPRVSYQNGLLTIASQNATLNEILGDVRKLTGASIDVPPGGGNERVVAQLGPGAPRDVLAQLLNGTSFNYVMVGTTTDANAVASVMLSSKPSSGGEVQTAVNNTPPVFQPPQQPGMPGGMQVPQPFRQQMMPPGQPQPGAAAAAEAGDESDDSDADDKDDDSDQAQPAQQVAPIPQSEGQVDPNQPNAGPKSPEQILQMMRQGQPGGPGGPPNGPGPLNPTPPNE